MKKEQKIESYKEQTFEGICSSNEKLNENLLKCEENTFCENESNFLIRTFLHINFYETNIQISIKR